MTTSAPLNNPGSGNHGICCKPCNKFNPVRPDDSCKHGTSCEFCHGLHERPKHRGQRGRHALQRRRYFEEREEKARDDPEVVHLVDLIYKVPYEACAESKRRLALLPSGERERLTQHLLERIREVGEHAQQIRPNTVRLRGARINTLHSSSVSDVDGKCKWLVGTLHLMMNKMLESHRQHEVARVVRDILDEVTDLPQELCNSPRQKCRTLPLSACPSPPSWCLGSPRSLDWAVRECALDANFAWLQATLRNLVVGACDGEGSADVEETLTALRIIVMECDQLPSHMLDTLEREYLLASGSIFELRDRVREVMEKCKDKLLNIDALFEDPDEIPRDAGTKLSDGQSPSKVSLAR